eukprot:scaffold5725_cov296-Skeletonema_marinoi.AAC.2
MRILVRKPCGDGRTIEKTEDRHLLWPSLQKQSKNKGYANHKLAAIGICDIAKGDCRYRGRGKENAEDE